MKKIHISMDIDWCPDFMIEDILELLSLNDIKCTFFITHKSKIIPKLLSKNHLIGIHPNFLKTNSVKKNLKLISNLINIFPKTQIMRSHALHMNSILLYEIFNKFPQIKYDLSMLTYQAKFIEIFNYKFIKTRINRINYNWEDSIAIHDKNFNWSKLKYFGEKNIYNFHPIHIFYNTKNFDHYLKIKKSSKNLNKQKLKDIDKNLINKRNGVRTYFKKIIKSSTTENNLFKTI